jgi:predicted phage baseplate assembly protein
MMPLPLPKLDKLHYDELVNEARNTLPALAPEWTDYNAHDPGITQIELLAWLTEIDSYRLGLIPEQAFRAYLRLAGIVQNQAQVAELALVFTGENASSKLPAGIVVPIRDTGIKFQTGLPLTISTAKLQAVLCGGKILNDITGQNTPNTIGYFAFGAEPETDAALYLGFDQALAEKGEEVSLWVWTGREVEDQATRMKLQQEHREITLERQALCDHPQLAPVLDWRRHYGVRTVWEYYAGTEKSWLPLQDVHDDTRALTLSGAIRFKAPAIENHSAGGISQDGYQAYYFIRCRIDRGRYDNPPQIANIALNAVPSRHAVEADSQCFKSNGRAGQRFFLNQKPVVPGSTRLYLQDDAKPWHETRVWDGFGPFEQVYILEPETGEIRFGDGRVGRVPPASKEITVTYQTGGGASGNIAAGKLEEPVAQYQDIKIYQPFAAVGGADAETLSQAKARAVKTLATPARAITLQDMAWLALNITGLPVARAYALADYHPQLQCVPVNGSNTVVILPPYPKQKPMPTPELCRAVHAYLERRRVLAGELYVIAPHYVTVTVQAQLIAQPQADRKRLVETAQQALTGYFNPLYGGSEQRGWPMGRSVYRSELLAILNAVPGVIFVDNLTWSVDGKSASRCGNLALCRHALVASGNHEITLKSGSQQ